MGTTWFSVDAAVLQQRHPGKMYPIPIPNFRNMGISKNILVRVLKSQKVLPNMTVSHCTFLLTFHFLSFVLW